MSILSSSRGKRESQVYSPLEEIKVDTVPNPESICVSTDSRFNYYLILCDRYSMIFRSIGISDKSSEACIDGIEQIISIYFTIENQVTQIIVHTTSNFCSEF